MSAPPRIGSSACVDGVATESTAGEVAVIAATRLVALCGELARTTPNPLPRQVSIEHFAVIVDAVATHIADCSSRAMRGSGVGAPLQ